ncbi:MAG TPA: YcnI family protein [Micromonosporaceae bacterium]|nr:YcnI family protein [Micromonosporaceae bacterium]
MRSPRSHGRRRHVAIGAAASLASTVAALLLTAGPASAHVTVSSANATQGGYTKLTFRVPNEKDTASTTKVEVNLPTDTPIASVSVKPVGGWTAQADKTKLATPVKTDDGELTEAITKITWTAGPDTAIKPGQFQEFDVSVGPLPERDELVFKALQTYSDGEIVRWIEEPAAGAEPEHPAPVLTLAKKGSTSAPAVPAGDTTAATPADREATDQTLPVLLGVAALITGLLALVIALLAYRRTALPQK